MTTARTIGRPTADELAHRCEAINKRGRQCGSPALDGSAVCRNHLGKADAKALVKTTDRLVSLTSLALDRLETIIRTGSDDVAERAARTILDRTLPKPGAQNAVLVNIGGPQTVEGNQVATAAEQIRARLRQLAPAPAAPASPFNDLRDSTTTEDDSAAWTQPPTPDDDEIFEAEIVDDLAVTPTAPAADPIPEHARTFAVPRVPVSEVSFEDIAARRAHLLS